MIATPHYHMVPKDPERNARWRRSLLLEADSDPKAAAQIKSMCAEDLLFYVNSFCWTFDPRGKAKVVPFNTYAGFQDEAMLELAWCVDFGHDAAMPKSRDMGASWMGLTVFEWYWHFQRHMSFLLVSRNEDYVDKRGNPKALFWKIDFLHENQPRWLLPSGRWLGDKDPNRKLLHLKNHDTGSVIDGESTTGDAGRGDRRTAMFIDEHAAFELQDGFKVLRSTRDTTDCRIFNSTPQGANTAFYEVVHSTGAKILRLHWSSHPEKRRGLYTTNPDTGLVELLDDFRGEVTVRRKGEDPRVVRFPEDYPFELDKADPKPRSPWYDYQCSRCVSAQEVAQELDIDFLGSSYPFFDPKFIRVLMERDAIPPLLVGDLEYDRATCEPKRFTENPDGLLELWINLGAGDAPPSDLRFAAGADVSAGTGASNSVVSLANRQTGEKVAVLRTPHMPPRDFADLTMALCRWFNGAYLVPDASGPTGQVFVKRLIEKGYGYVYHHKVEKRVTNHHTNQVGYYLNPQARAALFEDYRAALAERSFVNRSRNGLRECLQFIRRPDGGVEHSGAANSQDPSGARAAHGDEVVADALCSVGVAEVKNEQKADEPEVPVGSLAWRRSRRASMQRETADCLSEGW